MTRAARKMPLMRCSKHPRSSTTSHASHSCGFTLIEVLVSLVIMSIGMLGIAKLVMVSSHSNDSAYMRGQATALAYEILDRMRANPAGALAHNYDIAFGTMSAMPTSCIGTGTVCTPAQIAAWDLYTWEQHLTTATNTTVPLVRNGALPAGTAAIVTSATSPVTATIQVQWDDSAAQAAFNTALVGAPELMTVTVETVLQ
jgi:type IV pilus assembly protein PilV